MFIKKIENYNNCNKYNYNKYKYKFTINTIIVL
jgi:hypothetical protein